MVRPLTCKHSTLFTDLRTAGHDHELMLAPKHSIRSEGNEDYPEFFVAQSMLLIYPPMVS